MQKTPRLPALVHVHIYYAEMWNELKSCLNNITIPYDLYVTTVEQNQHIKNELIKFKTNLHFEIVENRGYDIAPFAHIINQINLDNYSYVIKIHTKRDLPTGSIINSYNSSGAKWRNWALSFLTKNNFLKCINSFDMDKKLGMTGDFHLITNLENKYDEQAKNKAIELLHKIKLPFVQYCFIAGTMFMCRAELLKPLQQLKLQPKDFNIPNKDHSSDLAHAIERFLGLSVAAQNYKIEDCFTSFISQTLSKLAKPIRYLGRFIYRKKINKKGFCCIKICKIPVLKWRI